jgi:hypothetical protein
MENRFTYYEQFASASEYSTALGFLPTILELSGSQRYAEVEVKFIVYI